MTNGISNSVFRSRLYKLALMGRGPTKLLALPPDYEERGVTPGDRERGAAIVAGRFDLGGTAHQLGESPWSADWLSEDEGIELHRFGWLGDLAALRTEEARQAAENLFERWDEKFGSFTPVSWRADVLAARIVHCLSHFPVLFEGSDGPFHIRFLDCLARQIRHLRRVAVIEPPPLDRIFALKGLIYGECCVISEAERIARACAMLEEEIEAQVLPDGSHVSRSPGRQFAVLEALIDMRGMLAAAGQEVPLTLRNAIDRMAPMTRFFRMGDGCLAGFHGGGRPEPKHVDHVLRRSDAHGRAPTRAHFAGFERVDAGPLVLILDGAAPAATPYGRDAHAGMLSFELSAGAHRLFVNCGCGPKAQTHWREALRTTAAHSTATVADTNSCELLPEGVGRGPDSIDCDRGERDGGIWISGSHDGYETNLGLTHRRRLYVNERESDLRGEDIIVGKPGHNFEIRFHLHPKVVVSFDETATLITFSLPDGNRWRLRTERPAALEDSVYWDDAEGPMPTMQLVVRAATAGDATAIKWRLRRLAE